MEYRVWSMEGERQNANSRSRHTRYAIRHTHSRGFTLVEMIVAVALFAIVMLVSVGALLSLTAANRKAQALQSVMNNLNVALDGMVRSIRMGTVYHCGGGTFTEPRDCPNGDVDVALAFEAFGGNINESDDQWIYSYDPDEKRIYKSERGASNPETFLPVTAPEISVDSMKFYVVGTTRVGNDIVQPKVVITVSGTAGAANIKTRTSFSLQATAVQRVIDL